MWWAAAPAAQIGIGDGLRVDRPSRTLKDLRDENVVKQRFDFSCGAAALATILHYGFNEPVTETDILRQLFDLLEEDELEIVRRTGFSLLHLQRVAQARGYNAQGFRLSPDQVSSLAGPVIVFIEPRGYAHFAVLRGVAGDRAYLADPSRGNIRLPAHTFLDTWLQDDGRGIIFVVEPATDRGAADMPLFLRDQQSRRPERMTIQELLSVSGWLRQPAAGPR
jgi:predicted double-glycine peptidase